MHELNNESEDLSINDNHWYSAETQLGKIFIGIDRMFNHENSNEKQLPVLFHKAIALIRGEALITHIEEWLNCGLLLQPATIIPTSIYKIVISKNRPDQDTGMNKVVLGVQEKVLEKLTQPSQDQLATLSFETSSIPVQFVLSEFNISKEQYDQIENGRVLLIPDSYDVDWRIKLLCLQHNSMCRIGKLSKDVRTLVITDLESNKKEIQNIRSFPEDLRPLTITLHQAIPISLDHLLRWKGENALLLDQSLRHYKADVRCETDLIASGQIISVADGYGINICN